MTPDDTDEFIIQAKMILLKGFEERLTSRVCIYILLCSSHILQYAGPTKPRVKYLSVMDTMVRAAVVDPRYACYHISMYMMYVLLLK